MPNKRTGQDYLEYRKKPAPTRAKLERRKNTSTKKEKPNLKLDPEILKKYHKHMADKKTAEEKARKDFEKKEAEKKANLKKYPGWSGDKPVKYKPRKNK